MTKAILEFNLPEDRYDYEHASHGSEYASQLMEIERVARARLKYEQPAECEREILEHIRAIIRVAGVE